MTWTDSAKLQLVVEFIRAYRERYQIIPGTIQQGGDDLGAFGQFLQSLAYTPEYKGDWTRLREDGASIDVQLTKQTLAYILAELEDTPDSESRLSPQYRERLKQKLQATPTAVQ
ncbi:MAG: hypothetical protein Q8P75_03235 [bacterium]|nr:hypothetical protein [bacterium]